ncbi:hypothetical protein [Massilia antarctica]|uniref:hypothetical protein n=1 Tax=Massilia antarctica TaxID=2765360 RepID=UPI0006BB966C|nr:hypothetical protein [Massilia sp. H27-R4]MCY0914423.1 hypothetical protein [Massilia sp. H27-R4]CUI03197.1 hypothetical protein BN2497_1171 [Janthinobacterium sp. CG23_2]CUU26983.1 hypothetical protein BN3177_1171 [Janthinobacterium sp. CG23_2]
MRKHLGAAMVYIAFLWCVIGGVGMLSPYALIWLMLCWPVAFISAWLIWYLAFTNMPFKIKAIRFGMYVLLCVLTAAGGVASGGDAFGVAFITTLLPMLGMFLVSYLFPIPKVDLTKLSK